MHACFLEDSCGGHRVSVEVPKPGSVCSFWTYERTRHRTTHLLPSGERTSVFLSTCASCLSLPGTRNPSSGDPWKSTVLSAQPEVCLHLFGCCHGIQYSSLGGPANFICQVSLIQDVNTWRRSSWPCTFWEDMQDVFLLQALRFDNMRWNVRFIFVSNNLNVQKYTTW